MGNISPTISFSRTISSYKTRAVTSTVFGWGLASLNPISINRSDSIKAFKKNSQRIKGPNKKSGWWIIIFPEGTRTKLGSRGNYSRTAAAVAKANNCSIIPVAHNAGLFWPKASYLRFPGKIIMKVGPEIITKNKSTIKLPRKPVNGLKPLAWNYPLQDNLVNQFK